MILCDTNIIIELYRNNINIVAAVKAIHQDNAAISDVTCAELEKYCLSHNMDFHDALIAATSLYHNLPLFTLNIKDFIYISGINLHHP